MALLYGAALLLVAIVWSLVVSRIAARRDARTTGSLRAELEANGLALSGDPLGSYSLAGKAHGVDVVVEDGGTQVVPGARGESAAVCMVRVPVRLEDQILCRAADVDAVMGPLPSAPRVKTGSEDFDASYALFGGAAPWATPALLARLRALGLRWLRVREGRCEVAFTPLAREDLPRVVAAAASVARLSWGEEPVDAPAGPSVTASPPTPAKRSGAGVAIAWGVALIVGLCPGMILAFAPPLLALDAPTECAPGAELREVGCGDDSSCVACSTGPDGVHVMHYVGCCLLGAGIVALLGLVVVTAARLARR